jgi:hypothetical protein
MRLPATRIMAAQAAADIGCDVATVYRAAERLGIPRVHRVWLFTPADVRRLKQHIRTGPGNPTFGTRAATARAAAARRAQARRPS